MRHYCVWQIIKLSVQQNSWLGCFLTKSLCYPSSQLRSQCQGFDRAIITQANTPVGSNIVYSAEDKRTLVVTPGIFSTFIKVCSFSFMDSITSPSACCLYCSLKGSEIINNVFSYMVTGWYKRPPMTTLSQTHTHTHMHAHTHAHSHNYDLKWGPLNLTNAKKKMTCKYNQ